MSGARHRWVAAPKKPTGPCNRDKQCARCKVMRWRWENGTTYYGWISPDKRAGLGTTSDLGDLLVRAGMNGCELAPAAKRSRRAA